MAPGSIRKLPEKKKKVDNLPQFYEVIVLLLKSMS